MLQQLHIQNYAIIDELTIRFSASLNIITGETGAGKSILMGALGLILGERADSGVLQQKDKKCVVEGWFAAAGRRDVKQFLLQNDLDADEELCVRREIAASGKSRAFINDTPVSLGQLKSLSGLLVDLHQQFDTLELGSAGFQQEVLDAVAGNGKLLQEYAVSFLQYKKLKQELALLQEQQAKANAAQDYNRFLFEELNEAGLKENELEELDAELKLLSNAEGVKQQLDMIGYELKESEQPLVQQLKMLVNKLQGLQDYHTGIPVLRERLQSAQVEINDIAAELEHINNGIQYSAERLQWVNDRIALGYKLQKKHTVTGTAALLEIQEQLQQQLEAVFNISETIAAKEKLADSLMQECREKAGRLSASRKKALVPFTKKVNGLLTQVGMPNARFLVESLATDQLTETGQDTIEFLFNANLPAGQDANREKFEPLKKVASGGELSRLMLCIKSLVAKELQLPTLIFDEIDTGISGEAARQVGTIMKDFAKGHQLIAITHQPQIAARADAHYFVYKSIVNDRIVTAVRLLNTEERITTIAQMLSGEKPTAAALQNAREMVGN
ncbi:MAG: DNA repair protein RecN [Ferruginibacter sp.]